MRSLLAWVVAPCLVFGGVAAPSLGGETPFIRGDANGDGGMDIADAIRVVFLLFQSSGDLDCRKAADVNDDGQVDLTDAIYGLQHLYLDGPPPPPPSPGCGTDSTPDALSCDRTACQARPPRVEIAEACPPAADQIRWTVTNLDPDPLALDWEIEGTAVSGVLQLTALGTATLDTPRAPGANVLVLRHGGAEVASLEQEGGVRINEVVAWNSDSLTDEDGDGSDWIELHLAAGPCAGPLDLAGWYLTDDASFLTKWKFPSVTLEADGYLVVFTSGKDRAVAGKELHTDFKLDAEGDYLALVAPDGVTVMDELAPAYPPQLLDVSYGPARGSTKLIEAGHPVLYKVPAAGDDALGESWADPAYAADGWKSGTTGLGFTAIAAQGFQVTCIKANVSVDSLAVALDVLKTPARQTKVTKATAPFIDYYNSGERGNFANDRAFPGLGFTDVEDFVVRATGTVLIPQAGSWSFGVRSDDGFRLEIADGARTFVMEHPQPRAPADTIQAFNLPRAGRYDLTLTFYERGGGSELELFAARGSLTTFTGAFQLVGDSANGGLSLLGFSGAIGTDVGAQMKGVNGSLWARMEFTADDPASLGSLRLRVEYEDGFVAYLNGEKVVSRNAPAAPRWNSTATANRPLESAATADEIDVTGRLGLLAAGRNVLAVHGLNDTAADGDFLIRPELVAASRTWQWQYMPAPTPGEPNLPGAVDFVRDVEFGAVRGFYDAPFDLDLSTDSVGAQIRYTLDGSTPTATTGTVYAAPLRISRTTVVRAGAFRRGYLDAAVRTRTFIFVQDVLRQSSAGQAPGAGWPTGSVNGQVLDYGMDPEIVNGARWAGQTQQALLSIPTISLVAALDDLFGSTRGIYVNAGNDGRAWERRTSVELIYPDGALGFGVDAGLRIRGAYSRSGANPKHSFRLFFRSEYGAPKLKYALFGGEGSDRFDKVDLKCSQNYSWAFEGDTQNTNLRDVFSRDAQREMLRPYTRGRFYHLYLNGQYWGLYETEERADAAFATTYLGGRKDDYDVVKNDSSGSRALEATDGTMDSYRRLYDAAVAGFSTDATYLKVQGLRSDGTRDPNGEKLVDLGNLMDYMACTYLTGDPDSPASCWAQIANNVFAIYNRTLREGFTWIEHDSEHSLGATGGLNEARLLTDPGCRSIGQAWENFNPAWLHLRLTANREYVLQFADRVNRHFSASGVLSPAANIERWLARASEIEAAMVAESARWGDSKVNPPRTKDDWQAQVDFMASSYFPQRTQIVIQQMRSVGMFPDLALVSFNRPAGEVAPGFGLRLSQDDGMPGTIYYTLDGSDPRRWGGAVQPGAAVFVDASAEAPLIARGSMWRYQDDGSDQETAWRAPGFSDSSWKEGPAQLGYGDADEATVVGFGPSATQKYLTTYFRKEFDVPDASVVTRLTLGIVRDDGAVIYLNGTEVVRTNMPAGPVDFLTLAVGPGVPVGAADESAVNTFEVDPGLLVDGRNVIAVEVHQESRGSSDISFDLELIARTAGESSPPIVIDATTVVRARVYSAGKWGALTEGRFTVGRKGLVINEVMASNRKTFEDPQEPREFPDWIEVYNGTEAAIDLGGMCLTDDYLRLTKWRIAPGTVLPSGGHLVFYADDDGTQGALHTNFHLRSTGERLALVDTDGATILDSVLFDGQFYDVSYGRFPDGADSWGFHLTATPGAANGQHAP